MHLWWQLRFKTLHFRATSRAKIGQFSLRVVAINDNLSRKIVTFAKWRLNCERRYLRGGGGKRPKSAGVKRRRKETKTLKHPAGRDLCPSRVTPRCLCFVVSRLVTAETHHMRETERETCLWQTSGPEMSQRTSTWKAQTLDVRLYTRDACSYYI